MEATLNGGDVTCDDERRWMRRMLLLVGGLLLVRLVYAAVVPLDLIHDEAYYWDWSRRLDWGYYSKPPMIAWVIAVSTSLGGSTPFVVRLPAVLLGTGAVVVAYLIGSRMYGPRVGFWAAAVSAATPGSTVMSLLMTIDAPFLFFWSVTLYAFWRMLERGPDRARWVLLATVTAGLGLLSKQTMVGFFALAGFFVLISPEDRRELLRPGLWLFGIGSLLFLAPVVLWNHQHGWITLEHTRSHFSGETVTVLQRLTQCGEYLAGQGGVVSPVTGLLLLAAMAAAVTAFWRLGRKERFLLCFGAAPLAGVLCLSVFQRVEPNWPAPFYAGAIVLLAAWAVGPADWDRRFRPLRRWFVPGVAVGTVCCVIVYAVPFAVGPMGLHGSQVDPTIRLGGWRELGEQTAEIRDRFPRPDQTIVVVTTGRNEAAELAFYLPDQPRVYTWKPSQHATSQYDIWGGPREKEGFDALILTRIDATELPPSLAAAFASIESRGEVVVPLGRGRQNAYRIWRGAQLRHWPAGDAAKK